MKPRILDRPRLVTGLALLAALPQLVVYGREVATGRYPGSAYQPRVDAVLDASRVAAEGGPFTAVDAGGPGRYSLAPGLINDLGFGAAADVLGRILGRGVGVTVLGVINLGLLAAAILALTFAFPPRHRLALVPLFLLLPLAIREYRSPDSVAVHGALATLGAAGALALSRRAPLWLGLPVGVGLFVLHKLRSVHAMYALAGAAGVALVLALRTRDRRTPLRLALALASFAALEWPWGRLLASRAADPRVVDAATMTSHNVWVPLVSGVGWTSNRWGVQPWDPKVLEFLSSRAGRPLWHLATEDADRAAREAYRSFWREAPGHLLALYLARVPSAIRDYFVLGWLGCLLWLGGGGVAFVRAWRLRDAEALAVLLVPSALVVCLLAQVVLIDPRLLYAYPLRFASGLALAASASALLVRTRPASPGGPASGAPLGVPAAEPPADSPATQGASRRTARIDPEKSAGQSPPPRPSSTWAGSTA
jgi:hypothetical protein